MSLLLFLPAELLIREFAQSLEVSTAAYCLKHDNRCWLTDRQLPQVMDSLYLPLGLFLTFDDAAGPVHGRHGPADVLTTSRHYPASDVLINQVYRPAPCRVIGWATYRYSGLFSEHRLRGSTDSCVCSMKAMAVKAVLGHDCTHRHGIFRCRNQPSWSVATEFKSRHEERLSWFSSILQLKAHILR